MASLVTFLSDYGLGDPFVGLCRAALLAVCPGVVVIDLSHAVAPQDVAHGAARLADAVRFVDQPAVHLAVVDPGVGTGRRAVVV
ncbi:MAG: SAM-dependent chlorinase/fluorinase, partial [Egibacteraceae bacterium]